MKQLIVCLSIVVCAGCMSVTKTYEPTQTRFRGYSLFSKSAAEAFAGSTTITNSTGDYYLSEAHVTGLSTEAQTELIKAITQGVVEGIKAGLIPVPPVTP